MRIRIAAVAVIVLAAGLTGAARPRPDPVIYGSCGLEHTKGSPVYHADPWTPGIGVTVRATTVCVGAGEGDENGTPVYAFRAVAISKPKKFGQEGFSFAWAGDPAMAKSSQPSTPDAAVFRTYLTYVHPGISHDVHVFGIWDRPDDTVSGVDVSHLARQVVVPLAPAVVTPNAVIGFHPAAHRGWKLTNGLNSPVDQVETQSVLFYGLYDVPAPASPEHVTVGGAAHRLAMTARVGGTRLLANWKDTANADPTEWSHAVFPVAPASGDYQTIVYEFREMTSGTGETAVGPYTVIRGDTVSWTKE